MKVNLQYHMMFDINKKINVVIKITILVYYREGVKTF